ncbi:polysaccharide deacetylase family protein [Natrononativus amylolyticus]|uniref:polysaccharide deacetylase family protein n=1 Tax=Natrononativus amylolyticus TaxID=2963434 RepID=UPI0020CF1EE2|nr:polysaccharide deacetylase family protein [Natrononativus amylolyticus]
MKRRTYVATAAAIAVAGCMSADDDDPGNESPTNDSATDDEPVDDDTETETESTDAETDSFDDFEDLDAWSAVVGSLSADEEESYTGSQSALLEADEEGDQVRIVRELDDPTDFTDRHPGLAMATPEGGETLIQLLDDDGGRIDFRQYVGGGLPFARGNFGIAEVDDDPDLSEIVEIQIAFWVGSDGGGELRVDDLHTVDRPNAGQVMIHLDGGYETHHTFARPLLEEHDYPAAAFVPTGRLPEEDEHDGDRLTEGQLEELADDGWVVGSQAAHGDDLTALEDRSQEDEIADARDWLADNGYDAGYFSYPGGRYDEETIALVEEHHDLAFAGRYPAHGYVTNPYLCSRVSDPTADDARRILELTAEYGGITTLAYYRLEEEESREAFEETLEAVSELEGNDLEVITPADLESSYVV